MRNTNIQRMQNISAEQNFFFFFQKQEKQEASANGPGDLGSIPGRIIAKTQKWYLMLPCLTLSIIK